MCEQVRLLLEQFGYCNSHKQIINSKSSKNRTERGEITMARKRMVTRTVQSTKVVVMCANTETAEIENHEAEIAGTYSDDKKLMKAVESVVATDTIKPVAIKSTEVLETLYGMEEQKFIENAEILPKRDKSQDAEPTDSIE